VNVETPYLTPEEAALYVRRDAKNAPRHMSALARHGYIKAVRQGRSYLFKKEWLDMWMENNAKGGRSWRS
jgi:predicted transcriptional regulator